MSAWQEGFQQAVSTLVLDKGYPAQPRDEYGYSWVYGNHHNDYDVIRDHRNDGCEFTPDGPGKSVSWSAFVDTFADNATLHGIYVTASCACGKWTDICWLYEGTLDSLLRDLLAIEDGD